MAQFLVLGGAHIDRLAYLSTSTTLGSSNPGNWQESTGGGGFNAARNLTKLGNQVTMISVRGGDAAGQAVSKAAEEAGINDMAQVFLDRVTPSYSAVLERNGDLVIGVADMDLYEHFTLRQLSRKSIREAIAASDHILCDANLPEATLASLADRAKEAGRPLSAIAISPAKVTRFANILSGLSLLFLNEAEAVALSGSDNPASWPDRLREMGKSRAVITRGSKPALAFDSTHIMEFDPPKVTDIADVTGAGDALAAATLHALAAKRSFPDAVRTGIAAAVLTLKTEAGISPDLHQTALDQLIAQVPRPRILT